MTTVRAFHATAPARARWNAEPAMVPERTARSAVGVAVRAALNAPLSSASPVRAADRNSAPRAASVVALVSSSPRSMNRAAGAAAADACHRHAESATGRAGSRSLAGSAVEQVGTSSRNDVDSVLGAGFGRALSFIGLANVGLVCAQVFADSTELPVFDLRTGHQVGSYRLTKCLHRSPTPRAEQ